MNIILITGGPSAEREVALSSSRSILKALRELGHNVKVVDPIYGDKDVTEEEIFKAKISKDSPTAEQLNELKKTADRNILTCINSSIFDNADLAFLGLHGKFGEDGRIQTLLDLRGIKYTGSDVFSSALAMDKDISKIIMNAAGIKTAPSLVLEKSDEICYEDLNKRLLKMTGYPCVVKPNDEGSTVGLTIVKADVEDVELQRSVELAFKYSDKVLIEKFIKGKELTVPVIGEETYPVIEIRPDGGFYDYEHKYTKGMTQYFCPADIPADTEEAARDAALKAHKVLGCSVISRVDFMLDEKNDLYCLEVNTLPGMTETSLVPKSAAALGIDFKALMEKIIDLSLKNKK